MATAARLGIPAEIINDARGMLTGSSQELETLLANLMTEKQKVSALQKELVAERDEFTRRNAELDKELNKLKTEEVKRFKTRGMPSYAKRRSCTGKSARPPPSCAKRSPPHRSRKRGAVSQKYENSLKRKPGNLNWPMGSRRMREPLKKETRCV